MADSERYPLLKEINSPEQLRQLPESQLIPLSQELRSFVIESVGQTGGHLAAGLGVIELTIALHYVFDTPHDRLVWDTGHQSYPHKVLTGRRDRMSTLRRKGGIAGFPNRTESLYDHFGVGHSSTSISAALGMALAAKAQGVPRNIVAIIGDGALTAGMAFEALNHAGDRRANLLVILNDNRMSISPNVGALSNYLARVLSGRLYASMRQGGKKVLSAVPSLHELARRAEEHVKGMVVPGTLFEELGFNYIGPIDGHDLPTLVRTLTNLRALNGPQFLHVVTQKGKGYRPAEADPCAYHGVTAFNTETGELQGGRGGPPTYTAVFGQWLCDMAERDARLVGITPAMREGSGLVDFAERFPERYYDVGIAEQHSVTLAAGLASEGLRPVVAIYSTFLQRAYDQLIHDVALQHLPVLFAIDRAGVVGPDGPTHAGAFDLGFLRCIPNMVVMAPSDQNECRQMLYTGFLLDAPSAVRYPRGAGPASTVEEEMTALPLGCGVIRREGRVISILAFGSALAPALEAGERLAASVADMRFVKPLDQRLILDMASRHAIIVTVEDNAVTGGAGSGVNELLAAHGRTLPVLHLGLPDRFTAQGGREELLADYGLDAAGIRHSIERFMVQHGLSAAPISDKVDEIYQE